MAKPKQLTMAIDPGVNGGIAWTDESGKTYCVSMPDGDFGIVEKISSICSNYSERKLFLEKPPLFTNKHIPGYSVGKMMHNYGLCLGSAVAFGMTVKIVTPQAWQKTHDVGKKGERTTTEWKNVLKDKACDLYPDCPVTLKTSDALLILHAGINGKI